MTIPQAGRVSARLFDADRPDERLEPERAFATTPTDQQLLWIDLSDALDRRQAEQLRPALELRARTLRALDRTTEAPYVALHQDYLHLALAANPGQREGAELAWLDIVAGRNVVITRHDRLIPFLDDIDERIERDATAGSLTAAAFLAVIVDAAIASYHAEVDAIEQEVDRLDALALRGNAHHAVLGELVHCRRRIAHLRRLLADHRPVFTALASPELGSVIDDPDEAAHVAALADHFDRALSAVEESREALLGSFDVYMSRTAQRTNEVMKVLTLATVLLLPGTLIAGLLGMNVLVPLDKDDPSSFWIVVGAIAALAVAIVVVARTRRWL